MSLQKQNLSVSQIPLVLPDNYKKQIFFSYTKKVQDFVHKASQGLLEAHVINEFGERFVPPMVEKGDDVINSFYDITFQEKILGKINLPLQIRNVSKIIPCLEQLTNYQDSDTVFSLREYPQGCCLRKFKTDYKGLIGYCNGVVVPKFGHLSR